jgi:5'-nucleotidase / UDP-sugar diphosphatase
MSNLSRRTFLKGVAALGAGAVLYQYSDGSYRIAFANAGAAAYEMRIVHTNDHHARIEPAPDVTLSGTNTRNLGGVARRKTIFDAIKTANPAQDILFLDAGDVFQGTLYFNLYSGQADLFFYNNLGYHAVAVGNHEFDKGDQTLANFIAGAQFPMLSANVGVTGGPLQPLKETGPSTANGKLGDATIVTLPSGKKVGIFGLTPPDTGLLSSPSANITFGQDLVAIAQAQVDALKTAGAELIVGLTHVGYLSDLDLAAKVKGINVIVGGHSHTPLIPDAQTSWPMGVATRVAAYPQVVKDPDGNDTVVVQDWEWAKWVGNIVLTFDAQGRIASVRSGAAVTSGVIEPVWADGIKPAGRALLTNEGPDVGADAAFQTKIDTDFKPGVDALANQKFAETKVLLDGDRPKVRSVETNLSNLITDALRDLIILRPAFNPQNLPVICITNGGGIRASIAIGNVTVGNAISVLPFGNTVATVIVTGAGLKAALENGVSQVESGAGRFSQVSGIRYLWNQFAPTGSRVIKIEVAKETDTRSRFATEFEPLDPAAKYLVVTNNFMLTGGDGYAAFTPAGGGTDQLDTGLLMVDVVQNYIKDIWPFENRTQTYVPIDQGTDGRIMRTQSWLPIVTKPAAFVD